MRSARNSLGLKRLELYAHPEDWPAIKALAEKLQRKRARALPQNKTPNVEFSGVPAGHSSNHPAGGASAGTQG